MTRETKVGLLVGLGIILLIGIIVSDHLSLVNHQTAADLTRFAPQSQRSIDTTAARGPASRLGSDHRSAVSDGRSRPEQNHPNHRLGPSKPLPIPSAAPRPLVTQPKRFGPSGAGNRLAADASSSSSVPSLSQTGAGRITSVSNKKDSTVVAASSMQSSRQPVIHYVKAGESLWQIAQRYYNNGEHWRWIAQANPQAVGANGAVRVGVRLVVPGEATQSNGPGSPQQPRSVVARLGDSKTSSVSTSHRERVGGQSVTTYTVVDNDSLYKIAARTLGNGDRWEDIYQANRDLLDHPDHLKVGQRLKIPKN